MRRKPKENNFKAVLETIRELMNTECVVPDWLHDIILGYGDPGAAHYSRLPNEIPVLDFNDTFLDMDHLRSSFPDHQIKVKIDDPTKLVPPFRYLTQIFLLSNLTIIFCDRLTFEDVALKKQALDKDEEPPKNREKIIMVEPHIIPNRGPYPSSKVKK